MAGACSADTRYRTFLNKPENLTVANLVAGEPRFNYPPIVLLQTMDKICKKHGSLTECSKYMNLPKLNMDVVMDMSSQLRQTFTEQQLKSFEKDCGIVNQPSLEAMLKSHPQCIPFFQATDTIGHRLTQKYSIR